jgi:hypothetical protein
MKTENQIEECIEDEYLRPCYGPYDRFEECIPTIAPCKQNLLHRYFSTNTQFYQRGGYQSETPIFGNAWKGAVNSINQPIDENIDNNDGEKDYLDFIPYFDYIDVSMKDNLIKDSDEDIEAKSKVDDNSISGSVESNHSDDKIRNNSSKAGQNP